MKHKDILAMRAALQQVGEGKMDPVNKKAVKKDFEDREDKDIDNDGDTDGSDKYLHKRRRKVTKAVQNSGKGRSEIETQVQEETEEVNELSKKTLGSYIKKAVDDKEEGDREIGSDRHRFHPGTKKKIFKAVGNRRRGIARATDKLTKESTSPLDRYKASLMEMDGQMSAEKVSGPAEKVQGTKDVKEPVQSSATKDTSKLDKIQAPKELDDDDTHIVNRKNELKANAKAASTQTDDVNKNPTVKEALEAISMNEDYRKNQIRYVAKMKEVAKEIMSLADTLHSNHMSAIAASDRIGKSYESGKTPSDADVAASTNMMYDCKYVVRTLEDARDQLEEKMPKEKMKEAVERAPQRTAPISRFGSPTAVETRKPLSTRDALAMMEERGTKQTQGATKAQEYDDNWSGSAKDFAAKHKVDEPAYADINKVTQMNKTEVGASLGRKAPAYRHNDQKLGDKKPVGNDGK